MTNDGFLKYIPGDDLGGALRSWHIEPTTKCALKCPRCPRTFEKGSYPIVDIDLRIVEDLLETLANLSPLKIHLCGNYGDPIYHPEFIKLISTFKKFKSRLVINTNGSGKNLSWWKEVGHLLDEEDEVIFSIDGADEETNAIYRQNAQWSSIMAGIRTLTEFKPRLSWKFIFFSHNYHQASRVRETAKSLGMKKIYWIKSNRFGKFYADASHDPMAPPETFVSSFTDEWKRRHTYNAVAPKCLRLQKKAGPIQGIYLSAEGYLSLCCWSHRLAPFSTPFADELYNLRDNSLTDILTSAKFEQTLKDMMTIEHAPEVCRRYCGYHKSSESGKDKPQVGTIEYQEELV